MTPYLALLSRLGILQGKACNRAELEVRQIATLPLKREMSSGKTGSIKVS